MFSKLTNIKWDKKNNWKIRLIYSSVRFVREDILGIGPSRPLSSFSLEKNTTKSLAWTSIAKQESLHEGKITYIHSSATKFKMNSGIFPWKKLSRIRLICFHKLLVDSEGYQAYWCDCGNKEGQLTLLAIKEGQKKWFYACGFPL